MKRFLRVFECSINHSHNLDKGPINNTNVTPSTTTSPLAVTTNTLCIYKCWELGVCTQLTGVETRCHHPTQPIDTVTASRLNAWIYLWDLDRRTHCLAKPCTWKKTIHCLIIHILSNIITYILFGYNYTQSLYCIYFWSFIVHELNFGSTNGINLRLNYLIISPMMTRETCL